MSTLPMNPLPTDALDELQPLPHARAPEPGAAAALTAALSHGTSAPREALRSRLLARVHAQAEANAALTTLRQPLQAPPQALPGGRAWALTANSRLVELEAGADLAPTDTLQELLLLSGGLRAADGTVLQPHDHALLPPGTALQAVQPTRLYLRQHDAASPFHSPAALQVARAQPGGWQPLREGVEIHPLHAEGAAISMLARFQAGGRVPAHPHGLDEECLMVEGDLFLGDVLLREGGFQFAPRGTQHGELFADAPCLLFFHGAIDPEAVDNGWRARQGFAAL